MAKNILEKDENTPDGSKKGDSKSKAKVKKHSTKGKRKSDKGKGSKKKGKRVVSSGSSTSSSSDSSSESMDPEQVMSSLALQLSLSKNHLKLKGNKVMKLEDLSPEQLQFVMSRPSQCHRDLPELSTLTLHECGGELYQMRKQVSQRLLGKVSKKKQYANEELRTQAQAEEHCKMAWMKRLLQVYELFGKFTGHWEKETL